ncbi:MAG TPA: SDR family NAD(P)-dependent oxidoreductase [Kofleriaceae bacterium]|nr:SDR family NAD(P)-dependent oxidoreductase [Kofleriaceae bacterium]
MNLENITAFVTGANRGLGRALVEQLLARGAKRVYAATRSGTLEHRDPRVVPVRLDVTDPAAARDAASAARDTELLVNNAGVLASASVLSAERAQLDADFAVNVHGVLNVTRAFAGQLPRGAAIVNVLSIVSMASMPAIGGYSASKAAAWSVTQALRAELAPAGVAVHAAFPGAIDTDMIRSFDMPKTSPADVARGILDGVADGTLDIAPDAMALDIMQTFLRDPRELARKLAG